MVVFRSLRATFGASEVDDAPSQVIAGRPVTRAFSFSIAWVGPIHAITDVNIFLGIVHDV